MATATAPQQQTAPDAAASNGEAKNMPERRWQIGPVQISVFANEVTRDSGPNQQTTRTIRNVRIERSFFSKKQDEWQSQPTFSLTTIHAAIAGLQKAAAYLEEVEAETTPQPF